MKIKTRLSNVLLAGGVGIASAALVGQSIAYAYTLDDDFSAYSTGCWSESTTHTNWYDQFNGYGSQCIIVDAVDHTSHELEQTPETSTSPSETHAALTTSVSSFGDFPTNDPAIAEFQTNAQLRTGSNPNAWERAWFLWHYTDSSHFYYVILKSNGWEIGKEDPNCSYNQCFLATGSNYTWAVGTWDHVEVSSSSSTSGTTFTVKAKVNGILQTLATVTDTDADAQLGVNGNPSGVLTSGKFGLYTEDADVLWGWVQG